MKISLMSLKLRNFKGIEKFEFNPNGKSIDIYGDNETGKTTLIDAYMWLLFGKNAADEKKFEVKVLDKDNNIIHNLENEVEGIFEIDGVKKMLKRTLVETWTKKKGVAEKVLTGTKTVYHIDGVPSTQKEYQNYINELINEEVFKMVSNVTYFPNLHWTKQREILIQMIGGVSENEIVGEDKKMLELMQKLAKENRTIKSHKKIIAEDKKKIKKELAETPARIDEIDRQITEEKPEKSKDELVRNADELEKSLVKENDKLKSIKGKNAAAEEKIRETAKLKQELIDIEMNHQRNVDYRNNEVKRLFANYDEEIEDGKNKINRNNDKIKGFQVENNENDERLNTLRADYKKVQARKFEEPKDTTCQTCGQELPIDQKEELINKARNTFINIQTSELNIAKKQGDRLSSENTSIKASIKLLEDEIVSLNTSIKETEEKKKQAPSATDEQFKPTEKYNEIVDKIKELEKTADDTVNNAETLENIATISSQIELSKEGLWKYQTIQKATDRRLEVLEQEMVLNKSLLEIEADEYTIERYNFKMVEILDSKINSRFKIVKFKLFNTLVNGGTEETCEILVKGVPYKSNLNSGAKVNAGVDVINSLIKFYDFKAPIFIDNRESTTKLIDTDCQLVNLFVSKDDKKLREVI